MQINFAALKRAALRVPEGPWDWEQEDGSMVSLWGRDKKDFLFSSALCNACHDRLTGGERPTCTMPNPNVRDNIACADPTTILRLLEELDRVTKYSVAKIIGLWAFFIGALFAAVFAVFLVVAALNPGVL